MAVTFSRLTEVQVLQTSATVSYANPATTTTYIRLILIHNVHTTNNQTVQIWTVPDNAGAVGTASNSNRAYAVVLTPGETRAIEFKGPGLMLIDENDTIQASASEANAVTFQMYGAIE